MISIKNWNKLFKTIRKLRKTKGLKFILRDNLIFQSHKNNKTKEVAGYSIWFKSSSEGLWGITSAVYFFSNNKQYIVDSHKAAEEMGISFRKYCEISKASTEQPGYNPLLRKKLLKACGLKEIPHEKRIWRLKKVKK